MTNLRIIFKRWNADQSKLYQPVLEALLANDITSGYRFKACQWKDKITFYIRQRITAKGFIQFMLNNQHPSLGKVKG